MFLSPFRYTSIVIKCNVINNWIRKKVIIITSLHEWIYQEASKFCVSRVILKKWWGSVQFRGEVTSFRKVSDTKGMCNGSSVCVKRLKVRARSESGIHFYLFRVSSRGSGEKVESNEIYELLGNCRKLGSVRFTWFRFSGLENVDTTSWFVFILNHSVRLTYPVPVSRVYYLS